MLYRKEEMIRNDYRWAPHNPYSEPVFISDTDTNELDRSDGYSMLHFINSAGKTLRWRAPHLPESRKLERILTNSMPTGLKKYTDILAWLRERYPDPSAF